MTEEPTTTRQAPSEHTPVPVDVAALDGDGDIPSVSVIIPTYLYASRLEVTVRSILSDAATSELIVVVDGCRDGSLEVLEAIAADDSRVVPVFVEHLGKSGAQSVGLERARGDVVLLLDQDVVARPGLVRGHALHHRGADHLVVVGYMPTVDHKDKASVPVVTRLYATEYESNCQQIEQRPELVLLQLWGGNVSLRLDDCRRVGLDFRYFGHEDQDFGIRCVKAGLVGVFDRALRAEHHHAQDASGFLWYSKMQGASRWQIHHDHADVLGPYDASWTLEGLPLAARGAAWLLGRPSVGDVSGNLLLMLGDGLARLGWEDGHTSVYRLARKVELRTGAALAMAGRDEELQKRTRRRPALAANARRRDRGVVAAASPTSAHCG